MNLLEYRSNVYTSIGNDGIIEKIFNITGFKKKRFLEFGAWDGIHGCNSRKLVMEGWTGTFIEPVIFRYLKLLWNYRKYKNIKKINSLVELDGKKTLDNLLKNEDEFDFISIDIDGMDFSIFETINNFKPLLYCIEGGQMLVPDHPKVSKNIEKKNIQQSLSVIKQIADKKGYKIICSYQDTFLIRKDYAHLFPVTEDINELYFNGLIASYNRLPWIKEILKNLNMNNKIINEILDKTNYSIYGYKNRKKWANDNKQIIIQEIRNAYK